MIMSELCLMPARKRSCLWLSWPPLRAYPVAALRALCAALAIFFPAAAAVAAEDPTQGVQVTPLAYEVIVDDDISSVKDSLVSALEGRNYSIVNVLNVQEALKNRNIEARPIQLIEFINLTKAYQVTSSDERFELFAPLRAALFEKQGKVKMLILRPQFISDTLGKERLSEPARAVLEGFDRDLREVSESVRSGGF